MGLCVLGFGLAAGFGRGLSQQFSRLLVVVAALLFCGPATASVGWSAESIGLSWPTNPAGIAAAEAVIFLLSLPVLLFARKLLNFLFGGSEQYFRSRLIGSTLGVLTGILLFVSFASAWINFVDTERDQLKLLPICEFVSSSIDYLPEQIQPSFIDWPTAENSPTES